MNKHLPEHDSPAISSHTHTLSPYPYINYRENLPYYPPFGFLNSTVEANNQLERNPIDLVTRQNLTGIDDHSRNMGSVL